MGIRTVSVKLALDVSRYVSGGQQAIKTTRDFRNELAQAASRGDLDAVANQATVAGLALTGAFAGIVGASANFDKAMSSVDAATMTSASNLEQLRQAALDAGADTAFSASEAAAGIEELAKAGVGTADILGGGLRGALDLAAAGQIDVADAAETAASAMTQFGLKGQDVTHIADLLAAGAGKAQGSVHDMSMALNQSGLVASQTGLSIEETTGTLAAFASAGLLGSDAGTSFKTMLLRLAAPSGAAADLMDQLGISAFDASGNFIGMAQLAGNLRGALQGMSQQQRQATLETIFGTDAIRAASIVYEQGSAGIQGWIENVDDQGFAAETAAKKLDNLMGDVEALTGSLETLAIQSGSGANEGLRFLTQTATALVNRLGEMPPLLGQGAVMMAGLTGAALLAFAAFVKMRGATAQVVLELTAMGPAGAKAAAGLQMASRWAGRAAGAFIALEIAGAAVDAMTSDLNPKMDALAEGVARFAETGKASGEAARILGDDFDALKLALDQADTDNWVQGLMKFRFEAEQNMIPGVNRMDQSLARGQERLEAFDEALAELVRSGRGAEAAAAFDAVAQNAADAGISTEDLKSSLPGYAAALEVAAEQGGTTAGSMEEIGEAASMAAEDVEELEEAFNDLFDIQMGLDEALIAYKEGLRELKEELDDGSTSLSLNTEEGLENRAAVLEQVDIIKQLRDANIANGDSIDEANGKYLDQLAAIEQTLIDRGYEEEAVRDLIGAYKDIPAQVSTEVETNADQVRERVEDFTRAVHRVPFFRNTTFDTNADHTRRRVDQFRLAISSIVPFRRTTFETNADSARRRVQQFVDAINRVPFFRNTTINTTYTQTGAPGGSYAERWGGVVHAQTGRLVPAHVTSSPTVMYGERATGREAYVPMRGDAARSTRILSEAASWYGMQLTRAGYGTPYRGSSGWAMPPTEVSASVDESRLTRSLVRAFDGARLVIDDRGNGRLVALQAGYYERAG